MRELELHSNPTSGAPPARRHAHLAACALMLFAGAARAQMPEAPALQRSVTPIRGMAFDHPHLPPLRTSRDGRVGVNLKTQGGELVFSVIKPESIGQAFDTLDPGVYLTHRWEGAIETPDGEPTSIAGHFEGTVRHSVLCDAPDATHPHADSGDNPRACGDNDCYDMVVLTTTRVTHASNAALNTVRLASMPITIEVGSPKTAAAGIERVIAYPDLVEHTAAFNAKDYVEPMVTTDGRMLVARIGKSNLTWYDSTGEEQTSTQEIVYAANPLGTPCDLSNFTTLEPITRAPFDAALRDDDGTPFYGIADRPFVDGEGQPIGEGELLKGTYPWIDRAGNTLFFTAVEATLSYKENEATDPQRRYDYTSTVDPDLVAPSTNEDKQPRRGVSMIGRWTRGKLVLLDNAINHTDYGLKTLDAEHVDVELYAGDEAWLRVGSARGNGADEMPGGTVTNSTFMDSFENLFNGDPNLRPVSPRDVVWRLNTGHGTDEIAFDDYLDPNALIVSEMTGSLRNTGMGRMLYGDGFYYAKNKAGFGFGFLPTSNSNARGGEVRIQNAATSTRWDLPSYGRVEGGVRMEPVALGGIVGKGLWLDGADDALVYAMPAQANPSEAWYVGLFVDARPAVGGGGGRQRLITFTDGTAVDLKGRQELRLINADGTWRKRIFLPADLNASPRGWMHLGLVMTGGGEQVEIYIDGMLTRFSVDATPFGGVVDGDLRIGAHPNAPAYRGWIDELKVLAYVPGPEVLCNHARGTLARLSEGAADAWTARAAYAHGLAHTWLRDAIDTAQPGDTYVCYHDYDTTGLVGVRDVEAETGLTTVRDALLFPEGPLVADQPRPDSSGNDFCLSCHVDEAHQSASLQVAALEEDVTRAAWIDPRRQPMQAPPRIFGHLPAELVGMNQDSIAPPQGWAVDCDPTQTLAPGTCVSPGKHTINADAIPGIDGTLVSLDIYVPPGAGAAPLPTVVYVHGGWFYGGSKDAVGHKATLFNDNGYVFVSVDYRRSPVCDPSDDAIGCAPDHDGLRWPEHPRDVAAALTWLADNGADYGIDAERIGLMGHSAGAHIASDVSTNPAHLEGAGASLDLVQCTVSNDIFAYDLQSYLDVICDETRDSHNSNRCARYNNAFDPDDRVAASPARNLQSAGQIGPFLVVHGTQKATKHWLSRLQAEDFVAALDAAGVDAQAFLATGLKHGEANDVIGAPDDQLLTPTILSFFGDCL